MQIKRSSKINKPLVAFIAIALLGLVAFLIYWFVYKPMNDSSRANNQSNEQNTDDRQAKNLQENPDAKNEAPNADKPTAPTKTDETTGKKQVPMTASADASDGMVFIRGGANYPVTGGSCYAQLSGPSGQSIRKDTTILQNPASTDCKTIQIPVSELSSGKWTAILHYTSNDYEGASSEVSFSL